MGRGFEQTLLQRWHTMACRHMRWCITSPVIKGMWIKITMRYHLAPLKVTYLFLLMPHADTWQKPTQNCNATILQLKISKWINVNETAVSKRYLHFMFIAALWTVAKPWRPPKMTTDWWVDNENIVYTFFSIVWKYIARYISRFRIVISS